MIWFNRFAATLSFKWTMCFALLMCQYLCAKCWEKIYFWQNENFPFESLKKIHIPKMSLSCDIYRWQVYKKAITKFCYKNNSLCLSVFSNCAYFIAGCMRSLAFFSLPHFPSSKTALLIPFLQENRKIVLVAHLASMLCYIFSLFIPYLCSRPKRALKEVEFFWIIQTKPLSEFFCKKIPKNLSDFLIFDLGATTCFIANSLLSPLLHVKIHASVGYQRPCYACTAFQCLAFSYQTSAA